MKPNPVILLVDPDKPTRRLLRIALEASRNKVFEADSGEAGTREAVLRCPDAIVLELCLPDNLHPKFRLHRRPSRPNRKSINYQQSTSFASAFYHADGNGNITGLIYSNQTIAAKYSYDPYGNLLSKTGPLADANTYRFSSQEYHSPSGLIISLHRFYDPNLQRWINRDPIREWGGINLYGYVENNPINRVDPVGHGPEMIEEWVEENGPEIEEDLDAALNDLEVLWDDAVNFFSDEEQCDQGGFEITIQNTEGTSGNPSLLDQYLNESGGRWGGSDTRSLNDAIASYFEDQDGTVIGGAGRASEEWISGPNGGTLGGTWVDMTIQSIDGSVIRIQTVSTLADGVTPTASEINAANRILNAFPNDEILIISKVK